MNEPRSRADVDDPVDLRRVFARIVSSTTGGPLRTIQTTGGGKPTGTFVSLKAKARAMPWESRDCEKPVMQLAEFCGAVHSLLSQPHRLEMTVRGSSRPLVYFPDLMLVVDRAFEHSIVSGMPFATAALNWVPPMGPAATRTMVIEVKEDRDPRLANRDYAEKLDLAAQVYERVGMTFVTILKSKDLDCVDMAPIRDVLMDRFTSIRMADVIAAREAVGRAGAVATVDVVAKALGGGAAAQCKVAALTVRRVLSIGLAGEWSGESPVRLINDGKAILDRGR
ncbi:hypothetical protein [Aureimonas jatrophae]|nr:hypothetical protein [Aureimonas jatrophae]MBB3952508.1 hypothetical protein [Aureimonas jatrophae]